MKLSALAEVDASGSFVRSASKFTHRIGGERFPAVAGRYMLYVSRACPWACRTLAVRALKGLEHVVPVTVVSPRWAPTKPQQDDHMGWVFRSCCHACDADLLEVPLTEPVFHANSIRAVYEAAEPDMQHVKVLRALFIPLARRRVKSVSPAAPSLVTHTFPPPPSQFTVPLLVDTITRRIVCNESELIMRDFNSAFDSLARFPSVNLRPPHLSDAIDELNDAMCVPAGSSWPRCQHVL